MFSSYSFFYVFSLVYVVSWKLGINYSGLNRKTHTHYSGTSLLSYCVTKDNISFHSLLHVQYHGYYNLLTVMCLIALLTQQKWSCPYHIIEYFLRHSALCPLGLHIDCCFPSFLFVCTVPRTTIEKTYCIHDNNAYLTVLIFINAANEGSIWSADSCVKSREARSKNEDKARIFQTWECWCYEVIS